MKRSFAQADAGIPHEYFEILPSAKIALAQIGQIETNIANTLQEMCRKYNLLYSEADILDKILRVFVRHSLITPPPSSVTLGSTPDEASNQQSSPSAYYLLHIEGGLLEHFQSLETSFGSFFSNIDVSVYSTKSFSEPQTKLVWESSTNPEGRAAQTFRFTIPCEPAETLIATITLTHSNLVKQRYEMSEGLRGFLLSFSDSIVTEEEVYVAVWSYIVNNGLVEGRERKVVRPDAALKKIIPADSFTAASLKQRLKPSLTPVRHVKFDYVLTPETALNSVNKGKSFDLNVSISDPISSKVIDSLQAIVSARAEAEAKSATILTQCECFVRSMVRKSNIDQLSTQSIDECINTSLNNSKYMTQAYYYIDAQAMLTSYGIPIEGSNCSLLPKNNVSYVHDFPYFVDVADDESFAYVDNAWTQYAADDALAPPPPPPSLLSEMTAAVLSTTTAHMPSTVNTSTAINANTAIVTTSVSADATSTMNVNTTQTNNADPASTNAPSDTTSAIDVTTSTIDNA